MLATMVHQMKDIYSFDALLPSYRAFSTLGTPVFSHLSNEAMDKLAFYYSVARGPPIILEPEWKKAPIEYEVAEANRIARQKQQLKKQSLKRNESKRIRNDIQNVQQRHAKAVESWRGKWGPSNQRSRRQMKTRRAQRATGLKKGPSKVKVGSLCLNNMVCHGTPGFTLCFNCRKPRRKARKRKNWKRLLAAKQVLIERGSLPRRGKAFLLPSKTLLATARVAMQTMRLLLDFLLPNGGQQPQVPLAKFILTTPLKEMKPNFLFLKRKPKPFTLSGAPLPVSLLFSKRPAILSARMMMAPWLSQQRAPVAEVQAIRSISLPLSEGSIGKDRKIQRRFPMGFAKFRKGLRKKQAYLWM